MKKSHFIELFTQSEPVRKWIPTKGPSGRTFLINSSDILSISSDHCKYFCSFLFLSKTGKSPGAPINAITGYFLLGNLKSQVLEN